MLEYLLFLPLVILLLLFFIFTYRLENNQYKKVSLIIMFFVVFPSIMYYQNHLMQQKIDIQAQKQLASYLVNFTTTFIEKPYGARQIRLKSLTEQKNKIHVLKLYREALSDKNITYNELIHMERKISDYERLEK